MRTWTKLPHSTRTAPHSSTTVHARSRGSTGGRPIHNKEFVRETDAGEKVHVNSAEGFFSIFKRGLVGTYQHMSEQHLHRYLAEFDFRMNHRVKLGYSDDMRADIALQGIFAGKRSSCMVALTKPHTLKRRKRRSS